jgi:phosphate transport system substrate-binding protein
MYVNKASIREKECVYDYLRFAFRYGGQLAEEVGYVQLPRQKYEQQLRRLDEIKKTR